MAALGDGGATAPVQQKGVRPPLTCSSFAKMALMTCSCTWGLADMRTACAWARCLRALRKREGGGWCSVGEGLRSAQASVYQVYGRV